MIVFNAWCLLLRLFVWRFKRCEKDKKVIWQDNLLWRLLLVWTHHLSFYNIHFLLLLFSLKATSRSVCWKVLWSHNTFKHERFAQRSSKHGIIDTIILLFDLKYKKNVCLDGKLSVIWSSLWDTLIKKIHIISSI